MAKGMVRVPVREQDPKVRATNFEEVCLGYNQEEAMEEAISRKHTRSSDSLPHFRQSVDVSARRSLSVKESVSVVSKEIRYPSENWSVLWQIMHWSMTSNQKVQKNRTVIR